MSCAQEDTLLNDEEVVRVVSVPPSMTDSELSSSKHIGEEVGALRGRWMEEDGVLFEVPIHSKKKKRKPKSFFPPPPPPPPMPVLSRLERIPGVPARRRAMFLGCLQCTNIIVVLYNGSPFKFQTLPHPHTMVVTTCRTCLKTRRNFNDESTFDVAARCEEASNALQLSAEFIQTSYMYQVASAVVGSAPMVLLERLPGAVAYVPIGTLTDEMDHECIPLGMLFNKPPEPPRLDRIQLLPYLPGGFL